MLTTKQVDTFREHGYLVVPDVLDAADLDPVRSEYESVLDAAAHELFEIGELNSTYASLPFERRYTTIIT